MRGSTHFDYLYARALLLDGDVLCSVLDIISQPFKLDFPISFFEDIAGCLQFFRKLKKIELNFIAGIKKLVSQGIFKVWVYDVKTQTAYRSADAKEFQVEIAFPTDFFTLIPLAYKLIEARKQHVNSG